MTIFLKEVKEALSVFPNGVKLIKRFFIAAFEVFYVRGEPVNPEHVEACRRIIKNGECNYISVYCTDISCGLKDHVECPIKCGENGKTCYNSLINARKWLADHGIKE